MSNGTVFSLTLGGRSPYVTPFAQPGAAGVLGAASSWLGGWGSSLLGAAPAGAEAGAAAGAGPAIAALVIAPDSRGRQVLLGVSAGGVRLWDVESEQPCGELPPPPGVAGLRDIALADQTAVVLAEAGGDEGFLLAPLAPVAVPDAPPPEGSAPPAPFGWGDAEAYAWLAIELPPGGLPRLAMVGGAEGVPPAPILHWPRKPHGHLSLSLSLSLSPRALGCVALPGF